MKCKICLSHSYPYTKNADNLYIFRCSKCHLEFTPTAIPRKYDIETFYRKVYAKIPPKFISALSLIKIFANGKRDLLDLGCGDGKFLSLCSKYKALGIDPNQTSIELCNKKGLNVKKGKIKDIGSTYDIITLFDVTEYLEDPIEVFNEINLKLNPYGIVYIESVRKSVLDFYLHLLSSFTKNPILKKHRIDKDHLYIFSDLSLKILFSKTGFKIVYFQPIQRFNLLDLRLYMANFGINKKVIQNILNVLFKIILSLKLLGRNKIVVIGQKYS